MPLGQPTPGAPRKPDIEALPDGRKRFTRYRDLAHGSQINSSLFPAYGTLLDGFKLDDPQYAAFANLRLVRQFVTDELPAPGRDSRPQLVQVFETLPATAEIQVGQNTRTQLEDGREAIEAEFLQLVAGAYAPGTIGTTTAPGDAAAYMQRAEQTNDGTLRRIKRTYVYAGTLSQVDDTRSGGKLLLRTIVAVKTAPETPAGFTLVDSDTKNPTGLPIYTRTYAKGAGRISTATETKYAGKLTLTTIRYLGADDEAAPAGTLLSTDVINHDGYTQTTKVYATGSGAISTAVSTEYSGHLTRTTITSLNVEPSASGAIVDTRVDVRDDGTIYTYTFVTGSGVIATSSSTNGPLTTGSISYLNGEPTIPSGAVITDVRVEARDGYFVKTVSYASGAGELSRSESTEYGGVLTRVTVSALNEEPDIDGTVISTRVDVQNGQRIITKTSVDGAGVIATSESDNGPLTTGSISYLNGEPTIPSGAVITDVRVEAHEGFFIKTVSYASGAGELSRSESSEYGGVLTRVTVSALNEEPDIDGTVISTRVEVQNGQRIITKVSVAGEGVISTSTSTNGLLTITAVSYLNGEPDVPANAVITDVRVDAHEGFFIKTVTYAAGSGTLSTSSYSEYGGKLVFTTIVSLNVVPTASGQKIATRAELRDGHTIHTGVFLTNVGGSLLDTLPDSRSDGSVVMTYIAYGAFYTGGTGEEIERDILPQRGYQLYKTVKYQKPSDYSISVNVTRLKPGVMAWNASGPNPSRAPAIVNISATAAVSFITGAPGSLPADTPINASCIAYERATFDDGKQPEILTEIHEMRDYYAPASGAAGSNTDYRGRHAASYAVDFAGQPDQAGTSLTLSATVEPYFRAGSLIVYKETVVTGVL